MQTRFSLSEMFKEHDKKLAALGKQKKAREEKEINDFIADFESSPDTPAALFKFCKCSQDEMESMSYFAKYCPGFNKENLIKHLKTIKPDKVALIDRIQLSEAHFTSTENYLKNYLEKAGQLSLDELCKEDQSKLDYSEVSYKAVRDTVRLNAAPFNAALSYFGNRRLKSTISNISKQRNLPDDRLAKIQNNQIYKPELEEKEEIGQHIARVHLSDGPYPKRRFFLLNLKNQSLLV
ncbi:MAG: hypothetical protein QF741_02055 [Candidatus Peribacteraceae bacterium]|jgi:Tfp pilus assembly protein PilE|nr:hypothetical protein [Candidatus Peribacteraceae bacterium]